MKRRDAGAERRKVTKVTVDSFRDFSASLRLQPLPSPDLCARFFCGLQPPITHPVRREVKADWFAASWCSHGGTEPRRRLYKSQWTIRVMPCFIKPLTFVLNRNGNVTLDQKSPLTQLRCQTHFVDGRQQSSPGNPVQLDRSVDDQRSNLVLMQLRDSVAP